MGDLIRAFQRATAGAVMRFDGHVAKLMGDGALVYFGYPRAHEDDAERAARAGLAVVEAVRALGRERGLALEARGGIATGLVVVGEIDGGRRSARAWCCRRNAQIWPRDCRPWPMPDTSSSRNRLGDCWERRSCFGPLGPRVLKGFADPVPAWAVLRESGEP